MKSCYCLRIFHVVLKGGAPALPFKRMMQASRIHHLTCAGIPKGLSLSPYFASHLPFTQECHYSTSHKGDDTSNNNKVTKVLSKAKLPPAPTTCCMSGCHNCVWLKYAEDLQELFNCTASENKQIILDQIEDPNMRAFLELELTFMANSCRYRPDSNEGE